MAVYTFRAQAMLDEETWTKLKALADADRRAMSDYLRIIVEMYLEDK